MQNEVKGTKGAERHPLWSKSTFLKDYATYGNVKKVCAIYGGEDHWRTYYNDVWRWKRDDPEFEQEYVALIEKWDHNQAGGRPRVDEDDKSWQPEYCRILLERSGNEEAARAGSGCPYSVRQMREFLSPSSSSYDPEFAEQVEAVKASLLGESQEGAFGAMREFEGLKAVKDPRERVNEAKIIEGKARTAIKVIEKLDPVRYGNRLNVGGTIQHQHSVEQKALPREERLALLWEDRKKFEEARRQLVANTKDDQDVVDAEILDG